MIVIDTKTPERPVNTRHEVCVIPINFEELGDDVKDLRIFILKLTEMFSDGEKTIPGKAGGKVKSLFSPIIHDFVLQ